MFGGSLSSDNVNSMVQPEAYAKLDAHFDNLVGGAKGKRSKQSKRKPTAKKTVAKVHKGGMCLMCGGTMKHMNDYDDEGLFNLYNKKGGAAPDYQVQYDYSSSMAKGAHGAPIDRVLDANTVSLMATESTSSLGGMQKTVEFGNVIRAGDIPFNYSGGAKSKTTKSAKPKSAKTAKVTVKPKSKPQVNTATKKTEAKSKVSKPADKKRTKKN